MNSQQLRQTILQMLTDTNPAQAKRMERAGTLEALVNSLMADYAESVDSANQMALNQYASHKNWDKLNYQLQTTPEVALQQVQERINATIGFSQAS